MGFAGEWRYSTTRLAKEKKAGPPYGNEIGLASLIHLAISRDF
jgi:hypothetical protein